MTAEEIRQLYDYNLWANHRILDACSALTQQQFAQRIESSFPSVRETLVHICAAEWIWLERWLGRSPGTEEWEQFGRELTDFARLRTYWADREGKLKSFVAALTPERLAAPFQIRTVAGKIYIQPLWQMLQHLVNHGSYHRGQVTMMLRQLGANPIGTDLITFYRDRQAQAAS